MGEVYLGRTNVLVARSRLSSAAHHKGRGTPVRLYNRRRARRLHLTIQPCDYLRNRRVDTTLFVTEDDGETSGSVWTRRDRDSWALDISTQCFSISEAHRCGHVHREKADKYDRAEGIVKVLDFGLAKRTEINTRTYSGDAHPKEGRNGVGTSYIAEQRADFR